MQRSKQQALMFLLGATLVGGALGFSADRYLVHSGMASQFGPRPRFYDELGLSGATRRALDSLASARECETRVLLAPHDSAMKAIRARFRRQRDSLFTKEQKAMFDRMMDDARKRADTERAKEPKWTCSAN
jgi:hypothetical protein